MHMKYREEADYRQAMDELCFSQVAKARMTRNLRQSLAQQAEPGPAHLQDRAAHRPARPAGPIGSPGSRRWQWPRPWCWRWGPGPQGG